MSDRDALRSIAATYDRWARTPGNVDWRDVASKMAYNARHALTTEAALQRPIPEPGEFLYANVEARFAGCPPPEKKEREHVLSGDCWCGPTTESIPPRERPGKQPTDEAIARAMNLMDRPGGVIIPPPEEEK